MYTWLTLRREVKKMDLGICAAVMKNVEQFKAAWVV